MASEFEHEFDPRRECESSFDFLEQFAKPLVRVRRISTKMRDDDRARRSGFDFCTGSLEPVAAAVDCERTVEGRGVVLRDFRNSDKSETLRTD